MALPKKKTRNRQYPAETIIDPDDAESTSCKYTCPSQTPAA